MTVARGPRPPSIWGACICFLVAGTWALIAGLTDLAEAKADYASAFPEFAWTRDWTIVALSAEFTIALIPIVWIFFVARRFARVMVSVLGVWKLYVLSGGGIGDMIQMGLIALSLLLLFTPGAYRWFEGERA